MNDTTRQVVLQARGLTKRFTEGRLDVTVLQGVDLQVHAGETLAVVGASGSGKSTLLHLLGGLDAPTSGSVTLMGQQLSTLDAAQQGEMRNRHLGFVYQFHHLLPEFSALDNVAMPLWVRRMDRAQGSAQAAHWLGQVGLSGRLHHRPAELSGGERQRVAIARALVSEPACVLADEPTGNLDSTNGDAVMDLLRDLHQQGATICMVTHDPRYARWADREVRLFDGKVVDCEIGGVITLNKTPFRVVGVFEHPGQFGGEIWGDLDRVMDAWKLPDGRTYAEWKESQVEDAES